MRVIRENNIPHGDIQLVFTVAEEGGLHGSKNLDPASLKADLGYVLDAGGPPGQIITMAPQQNSIVTVIHGKAAHAGIAPEEGLNAIMVAAKALVNLEQGRIDRETTANVGIIHGGIGTNIVPDRVVVMCEARSHNAVKLERQTRHMCETFEQVAVDHGARAEVTIGRAYDAFVLAADSPVVSLAQQAALSVGLPVKLVATGGGSDANYFNHYGVPCAALGIGMSKVHTTEEFITEIDLYHNAQWVVTIVQQAAKRGAGHF
jgi:tripeptide aminopeptidase